MPGQDAGRWGSATHQKTEAPAIGQVRSVPLTAVCIQESLRRVLSSRDWDGCMDINGSATAAGWTWGGEGTCSSLSLCLDSYEDLMTFSRPHQTVLTSNITLYSFVSLCFYDTNVGAALHCLPCSSFILGFGVIF